MEKWLADRLQLGHPFRVKPFGENDISVLIESSFKLRKAQHRVCSTNASNSLEAAQTSEGPETYPRPSNDIFTGEEAPNMGVVTVVAVVAHHK